MASAPALDLEESSPESNDPKVDLREGLLTALKVEFPELVNADKIDLKFLFGGSDGKARFRLNAYKETGNWVGQYEMIFSRFIIGWKESKNVFYETR